MNDNKIAIAYGRVSTADQKNSINAQDAKMLDYAKYKGLKILPDGVFFEEDTSGSIPIGEREKGALMLQALEQGRAQHLIITKLDRLGRNAVDLQNVWRYLTCNLGVTIHVIDLNGDSFSSKSPVSRFIVGMLSLFAELDRDNIRTRIIDVFAHKFQVGEQIGGLPYGWTTRETNRMNKAGKPIKEMIEHPEEMKWLKQILAWRLVGTPAEGGPWPLRRIADELNALNVPTKRTGCIRKGVVVNGRWRKSMIRLLLNSKHVTRLIGQLYPTEKAG